MVNLSDEGIQAHEAFPWIHVVWSNLKRVLGGVDTKASRAQLQGYLDLFAFRFNHQDELDKALERGLRGKLTVHRSVKTWVREAIAGPSVANE